MSYSQRSVVAFLVNRTLAAYEQKSQQDKNLRDNKHLSRVIQLFQEWDLTAGKTSIAAPVAVITFTPYLERYQVVLENDDQQEQKSPYKIVVATGDNKGKDAADDIDDNRLLGDLKETGMCNMFVSAFGCYRL